MIVRGLNLAKLLEFPVRHAKARTIVNSDDDVPVYHAGIQRHY